MRDRFRELVKGWPDAVSKPKPKPRLLQSLLRLEDQGKILGAIHLRIPMPALDERRALQIEHAEADERFWIGLQEAQEDFSARKLWV
jgi:hypothetical protein